MDLIYPRHMALLSKELQDAPWRLLDQLQAARVVGERNVRKLDFLLPILVNQKKQKCTHGGRLKFTKVKSLTVSCSRAKT